MLILLIHHHRTNYCTFKVHHSNPSGDSTSNPSINARIGRALGSLSAGSAFPCVNDMQWRRRGEGEKEEGRKGGRKEGHLHKTCKNAQKPCPPLSLLLHLLLARIDMQGAPHSRDAGEVIFKPNVAIVAQDRISSATET